MQEIISCKAGQTSNCSYLSRGLGMGAGFMHIKVFYMWTGRESGTGGVDNYNFFHIQRKAVGSYDRLGCNLLKAASIMGSDRRKEGWIKAVGSV